MPNGFSRGRGFGFGRGMGFGFRGSSPPWPYIGRGRGGLSRCGYFFGQTGMAAAWPYPQNQSPYYGPQSTPAYTPFTQQMSKEEELSYLKDQAEAIKGELEKIESRIIDLGSD